MPFRFSPRQIFNNFFPSSTSTRSNRQNEKLCNDKSIEEALRQLTSLPKLNALLEEPSQFEKPYHEPIDRFTYAPERPYLFELEEKVIESFCTKEQFL